MKVYSVWFSCGLEPQEDFQGTLDECLDHVKQIMSAEEVDGSYKCTIDLIDNPDHIWS